LVIRPRRGAVKRRPGAPARRRRAGGVGRRSRWGAFVHRPASGDSDICSAATAGVAPFGASGGSVELQAQPLPIMHLVEQLMQPSPQAHIVLGQTMQQPVESSWHPLGAAKTAAIRNRNAVAAKNRVKRGTVSSILDDRTVFVYSNRKVSCAGVRVITGFRQRRDRSRSS
jgi:hypothetical protein